MAIHVSFQGCTTFCFIPCFVQNVQTSQGLPRHIFFDEDHPSIWIIQGFNSWCSAILVNKWTWYFKKTTWDLARKIWTARFSVLFENIADLQYRKILNFWENQFAHSFTLPETNIAPENPHLSWYCKYYQNGGFSMAMLVSGSVSHRIYGTCNFYVHENHKNQRHIYPRRSSWPFYRDFASTWLKYQNLAKQLWIPKTHEKWRNFYTPKIWVITYNPQKCRCFGVPMGIFILAKLQMLVLPFGPKNPRKKCFCCKHRCPMPAITLGIFENQIQWTVGSYPSMEYVCLTITDRR